MIELIWMSVLVTAVVTMIVIFAIFFIYDRERENKDVS